MKKNNGNKITKAILIILLLILIIFSLYEIVFNDVFEILDKKEKNPIEAISNFNQNNNQIENNIENCDIIEPILNGNEAGQSLDAVIHYYYNQLDEQAKIIYEELEKNINNMQSGTYKVDFGSQFNDLLNSLDGEKKLNEAFQSAWNAFTYDYVDIFYINVEKLILTTNTTSIGSISTHRVYLSSGDNENYLADAFTSYNMLKQEKEKIGELKRNIISTLEGYSEYDQIRFLHDWMIDNFEYDITYTAENSGNIYGAFTTGKIVCEGYARAFKYILDGLGIPCILVSGTATNSTGQTETHAWNYVQIDEKWYAIDLTWDDPIIQNGGILTNEVKYKYFLRGSEQFMKNHEEDGYITPNSMKFTFPTLENQDYIR